VNRKTCIFIALFFSALILVPVLSAFAITPKPKIVIRMDLPIRVTDPGTTKRNGDNVVFKDLINENALDAEENPIGANLTILQWLPNTEKEPSHVPAASIFSPWPITHWYTGGVIYAVSHGSRDQYTMAGKWHMDWTVTWNIGGVDSGFKFRHDCTGIGVVHAAEWGGEGFGLFEGVKVSGISIAYLMEMPVTKIALGEVTGGFDNLPPRNIPPFT